MHRRGINILLLLKPARLFSHAMVIYNDLNISITIVFKDLNEKCVRQLPSQDEIVGLFRH